MGDNEYLNRSVEIMADMLDQQNEMQRGQKEILGELKITNSRLEKVESHIFKTNATIGELCLSVTRTGR